MMTGETNYKREAVLPLFVQDATGNTQSIVAIIDTGFTDALLIDESLARRLNVPQQDSRTYELADGSTVRLDRYRITLD